MKITKNELKQLIEEVKQEGRRRGYRYGRKKYFGEPGFSFDTGRNQPYRLIDDEPDDVDQDDDGELSPDELRALADELEASAENLADLKFADRMRDPEEADAQLARDRKRFGESKIKKSDLIDVVKEELRQLLEQSLAPKSPQQIMQDLTKEKPSQNLIDRVKKNEKELMSIVKDDKKEPAIEKIISMLKNDLPVEPADAKISANKIYLAIKGKLPEPVTESVAVDVVTEDGHEDVSSARRSMKAIIEDAGQMLQALNEMDGHLPTWWTNKMAVAVECLDVMRNYLLIDSSPMEEALGDDDETDTRQAIAIAQNREAIKKIKTKMRMP